VISVLVGLLSVLLVSCAPIQEQTIISTPVGQSLTAGVGDVVLRAEGRENLPNVLGRADLWGRTRPTGYTTIQYGGMRGDKVMLLRVGVTTQSDATTMNSSGMLVNGSYIPPSGSTSVSSTQPTIPMVIDWQANPRVPAAGRVIVIEAATPTSLSYRID
jgi:hypothetical protein